MKSEIRDITKLVPFTIDNQVIGAASTWLFQKDVERADWEVAFVSLWNKPTVSVPSARRLSGFLVLTKDIDDGVGQASLMNKDEVGGYGGLYYTIVNHYYSGYSYAVDSSLTPPSFNTSGVAAKVKDGKINGTNLEMTFENIWPSGSCVVDVEGRIKLYRKKVA